MKSVIAILNRVFTSWYKALGFLALAAILFGLLSYFVLHAFYLVSDRWLAPVILSPSHQHVIDANTQLASHEHQRDQLVAERARLATELAQVERTIKINEMYIARYESTLDDELASARAERATYDRMLRDARRTGGSLRSRGKDLERVRDHTTPQEQELRLITREAAAAEYLSMARIDHTDTEVAEAEANFSLMGKRLDRRISALSAARAGGHDAGIATYDVLTMERDRAQWRLETEHSRDRATDLRKEIELVGQAIARYDHLIAQVRQSPYLRAFTERITIAFVPYDNLDTVRPGEALYACALGLAWCSRVGRVVSVIPGEVTARHPQSSDMLRGQMVEIDLEDDQAAEQMALFAGHKPLLPF